MWNSTLQAQQTAASNSALDGHLQFLSPTLTACYSSYKRYAAVADTFLSINRLGMIGMWTSIDLEGHFGLSFARKWMLVRTESGVVRDLACFHPSRYLCSSWLFYCSREGSQVPVGSTTSFRCRAVMCTRGCGTPSGAADWTSAASRRPRASPSSCTTGRKVSTIRVL